jgi:TetR/AcrR family transcriptional repressor of mexJK operon
MTTKSTDAPTDVPALGRPRSEEKRAAILEAASNLFLTHGPGATSMDAVAGAANVSKQTVYSHFGDKESLFEACIQSKVSSYRVAEIPDLAEIGLREALTEIAGRFMDLLMDPHVVSMFRVVIGTAASHPEIGALFYRNGPGRTIDALADLLESQSSAGHIEVQDPKEAAALFMDMLAAHLQRRMLLGVAKAPGKAAKQAQIERTVDRFMRLFAAAPP